MPALPPLAGAAHSSPREMVRLHAQCWVSLSDDRYPSFSEGSLSFAGRILRQKKKSVFFFLTGPDFPLECSLSELRTWSQSFQAN